MIDDDDVLFRGKRKSESSPHAKQTDAAGVAGRAKKLTKKQQLAQAATVVIVPLDDLDDEVIDLVEPFIGPDIGLWSSHFICKEAAKGPPSAWHADSDYWNGRFEAFTGIVTLWLAIDASDRGNGCMRVIPGSHKTSGHEYRPVDRETNTFGSEIVDVDESKAVYFELKQNECSFHDSRIVHGAEANTSDRRRCGYTMRYFSQQMKLNLDHPSNETFKLWHCRGRNVHGNPVVN